MWGRQVGVKETDLERRGVRNGQRKSKVEASEDSLGKRLKGFDSTLIHTMS